MLGALAHALTSGAGALPGAAPASPAALVGGGRPWRLVFSAPAPLQAWRYIPVPEFFSLPPPRVTAGGAGGGGGSDTTTPPSGPVCLSSDIGPLHFAFSGAGRFLGGGGSADEDAVLEFAFARADVQWGRDAAGPFFSRALGGAGGGGGGEAGGAPKKTPKTYTFFAYLPAEGAGGVEVVGARSSGGALSLLAR